MRRELSGFAPPMVALALTLGLACAHDAAEDPGQAGVTPTGGSGGAPGAGQPNVPSAGRPPELENEDRYLAPVVTGKYLWTANPLSGRIALIDVTTLAVTLETAGNHPTRVVGLPEVEGRRGALVLNERSSDATLFRLSDEGRPIKHAPLRTHADANAWAVSASGLFAVAWTDVRLRENPDLLETFQDITLLSLDPGHEAARVLSVGVRPSLFVFSEDDAHAYAVTEEGISVIQLGASPQVLRLVPVSDDPLENPRLRDVSFAPDASYAVVRTEGKSEINIISLPEGSRRGVGVGGVVTDVDLSPDGELAYVVLGFDSRVLAIPLADTDADPASFASFELTGHDIGSIALNTDASAAVLYSNALGSTRVTLIETADFDPDAPVRSYDLIAPVAAVFAAPDSGFAVTFQGPAEGSTKAGAFSVLSLQAPRVPKIVATDAEPTHIAFAPEGDSALIAVRSDARQTFGAYVLGLATQSVDFVPLASPPESAGVVPSAGRAYVAQSHPEGRITFISIEDKSVQTLTGFELSARIRSD